MTMFMAHNGRIALGDPNAAADAAWAAQLLGVLHQLNQADTDLRQSFLQLSAIAQQQGGLPPAVLQNYNSLAARLNAFNTNVLQFLRTGLPKLTGLPSQIRRAPTVGYTPSEEAGALATNLTWNTAGCGLGAAKAKAAEEAVEWLGVKIFGKKVATAAVGASAVIISAGLTVGGVGWLLDRNEASKIALDASVQKNATGLYKSTYDSCMLQMGDPTQCQKNAADAYAAYIKGRVQSADGGGWGFFKWLGVLGVAGAGLVIFQRYRAGAFPFAPHEGGGHGWKPAYALPGHPRTIKEDDEE